MSATGRDRTDAPAAGDLAAALADAGFVRLLARPDGDAVAATGVLAGALNAIGTPFQASVTDPYAPTAGATQSDYTVAVGDLDVAADAAVADDVAASATAFDVAGELAAGRESEADSGAAAAGSGGDAPAGPDPILALAGTVAAGEVVPPVVEAAEAAGADRRPGVALPVADPADGLAHSTLLHAPFSGDVDAATAALTDLELPTERDDYDEESWRRLASLVALDATDDASERAAEAVERALRPHVGGPLETVGGLADVLDAAAREQPGIALSLALGHEGARDAALAAWRDHAAAAHDALVDGETARYDGLFVVRARSMPVGTVARLAMDFRSPEPVTLAVADGEAAIRAAADGTNDRDAAATLATAAESIGATAIGSGATGRVRFATAAAGETDDWTETGDELVAAVREAL